MYPEIRGETELMWLSTCASSVETRCEKNTNMAATHPIQASARTSINFQCCARDGLGCGMAVGAGEGCPIVSMTGLVAIRFLSASNAPSQVRARLVKAVQGFDMVIISASKVALGCDDFNIRSHTGFEPSSRSFHFLPSQRQAEFSDLHRLSGGIQLIERSLDLLYDGIFQITAALIDLLFLKRRPLLLGSNPTARPQRKLQREGIGIGAQSVV